MQMPWFKIFYEARTDPKLLSLTRDEHFVWFNLLCYAAEQPVRGVIESFSDVVLARAVADGDVDLLLSALETMERFKIISCNTDAADCNAASVAKPVATRCITMLNFAKRQGESVACNGGTSTERSRKCREKKKLRRRAADATPCNAAATLLQRDATTDKEKEEEKENTPPAPQGATSVLVRDSREQAIHIEPEPEPFDSGQADPIPATSRPKAKFPTDADEANRLILKAESVFPRDFDIGLSVSSTIGEFPAAWISEALDIAREKRANGWVFVRRVLTRFTAQGGSDNEKAAREWEKKQSTSLWHQPAHVPAPDPKRPPIRYRNALSDSEILQFRETA